ncbi:MAG: glycosyl hydrolase family 65 protein, partial [Mobilitalea sp.]
MLQSDIMEVSMNENRLTYEIDDSSRNSDDLILNETIFHNANGYIGIRANYEEDYPTGYDTIRGSYINGFYDIAEMKQAEKLCGLVEEKQIMPNIADTQGIKLFIDGEEFSRFIGEASESKRWIDMGQGYTGRRILWNSPKGKQMEIVIKRMTSFCQLNLFTIEYTVKALNFDGIIEFISTHKGEVMNYSNPEDPRVASESIQNLIPSEVQMEGGISFITSLTAKSELMVCTGVKNILSKECNAKMETDGYTVKDSMSTNIRINETVVLTKYTVFTDSIRNKDVKGQAVIEMEKATLIPLSSHYEQQIKYLDKYWDNCDLEIEGDDKLCQAVHYNLYQLIQSVGKDKYSNIAAKGVSGEGYEGHYFWDTEMYIQPFFTLTNPNISKKLIEYRYATLEYARANAKILGHSQGVLYPWRTIMGKECSGYFPSGTAQYHINGDIAHSIVDYYLATKDLEFIEQMGAEIIFETARLWIDTGNFYKGSFFINDVTGPDEYTCMVNNNYYTNVSAQSNLLWASKFYYLLKEQGKLDRVISKMKLCESEIIVFEKAAEYMCLPYDEDLKINPQDDSFLGKERWDIEKTPKENFPLLLHYHPLCLYRYQVCKQADTVMAHFIYEDAQTLDTIRNSYEYYEKITTHDSSLSTCIFSIMAAKLGMKEKAYQYFGDSAELDICNTHKNTKDGIHTANMGGTYMSIVYGFAGLRLKEEGLFFAPMIPEQWEGFQFKVNYEGSKIMVEINQKSSTYTLLCGDEKSIHIYGKAYQLQDAVT